MITIDQVALMYPLEHIFVFFIQLLFKIKQGDPSEYIILCEMDHAVHIESLTIQDIRDIDDMITVLLVLDGDGAIFLDITIDEHLKISFCVSSYLMREDLTIL